MKPMLRRVNWMPWMMAGALLYVILYWHRLLLRPVFPVDGNTLRLFYPSWVVGRDLLLNGFSLLWDPYRNAGQPFLADPQQQALYPLRWISVVLSYLDYQRVFIVFHVMLASVAAGALGWRWNHRASAAALCGLAAGFNGLVLARVTLASHFATLAWAPATLWALEERRVKMLAAFLALQWMAGFPPFFLLSLLGLAVAASASQKPRKNWFCLGKSTAVAMALCAVQILPFLELLRESVRSLAVASSVAVENSVHPWDLLRGLFLPAALLNRVPLSAEGDPAILTFFFSPFLLAPLVWAAVRGRRRERILVAAGAVAAILSLGRFLGFYSWLPGSGVFRFPANWMFLACFLWVPAAGRGLALWRSPALRWVWVGLVAMDLLVFAWPLKIAWADAAFVAPSSFLNDPNLPPATRLLHAEEITSRVHTWTIRSAEDWRTLQYWGVPSIAAGAGRLEMESYTVLMSRRHANLLAELNHRPIEDPLFDAARISAVVRLRPTASGNSVPEPDDFYVQMNRDCLPLVFSPSGRSVSDAGFPSGDVSVEAEGPGELVLSQSYYPGWKVELDGRSQPADIFENIFPRVALPAGSHVVRFHYFPMSFQLGLGVSLLTLVIVVWKTGGHRKKTAPVSSAAGPE